MRADQHTHHCCASVSLLISCLTNLMVNLLIKKLLSVENPKLALTTQVVCVRTSLQLLVHGGIQNVCCYSRMGLNRILLYQGHSGEGIHVLLSIVLNFYQ